MGHRERNSLRLLEDNMNPAHPRDLVRHFYFPVGLIVSTMAAFIGYQMVEKRKLGLKPDFPIWQTISFIIALICACILLIFS
jgi:cytochrome c oxidase assembly factor CtaG